VPVSKENQDDDATGRGYAAYHRCQNPTFCSIGLQTLVIYWKAAIDVISTATSFKGERLQLAKSRRAFAFVANDRQGREVAQQQQQQ
jgi:hypothetical protein